MMTTENSTSTSATTSNSATTANSAAKTSSTSENESAENVTSAVASAIEARVTSGTAFQAVPLNSKNTKSNEAQTEFGLAELNIEEDLETLDFSLEGDMGEGLPLPDAPIEADGALLADIHSIPEKMAFKIGEAAEMVGVKQYVLRYWESEFEMLRPRKSRNGQRVYSRRDVECAMMIKKLLYNDRFSIEGARHALRQLKTNVKSIVKEEKTTQVMARTQEVAVVHMRSLVEEIRRIRLSF